MTKLPIVGTSYNPFDHRNVEHPTSDVDTFIHLLKGSLGSGILAMPMAFKNSGLWFGLIATLIIGSTCTYCINLLVKCAHILCHRRQIPSLSYSDVAEQAFLSSSSVNLQKFSGTIRLMVDIFLIMDLLACCCIYIVFIGKNMKQVVDYYLMVNIDIRIYMIFIMLPLISLSLIRNLKFLAPFSMVANLLMFISVALLMYYIFTDIPPITSVEAITDPSKWPLFFGVVIFALEGIGVVLPLENEMKHPAHFIGCPSVLSIGMGTVVALYIMVGFFGYWKYGYATCGSVSLNVPTEEILAQAIKIMLSIGIILTYPLQIYVPVNIIWKTLKKRIPQQKHVSSELLLRVALVLVTVVIAIAIPELGPLISLIGAICLSTLGIMIPAIIEIVVYKEHPGWGTLNWILNKNLVIIAFGICGFATGLYISIEEIINTYVKATVNSCA